MPNGYTAAHIEWLARRGYWLGADQPSEFEVLLYNDAEDDLGFEADLDDITTEPTSAAYDRAVLAFPSDLRITVDSDGFVDAKATSATFDFDGVEGEVDYAGVVWEANLQSDPGPTKHLMVRSSLGQTYDLGDVKGSYEVDARWQLHTFF